MGRGILLQPNGRNGLKVRSWILFKFPLPCTYINFIIAAAPPFSGPQCFSKSRGFKQWTGDDSKALMKVFLPAIAGLVLDGMVWATSAFMDFCYLVCRSQIDETVLKQIDDAVDHFHHEC